MSDFLTFYVEKGESMSTMSEKNEDFCAIWVFTEILTSKKQLLEQKKIIIRPI